ncbi:hypothetical protein B0O99DRAFT_603441 [Bisporella sp. PMI_857]|nr:hypothetical protein B0O99DRAFT_603441 [Bisporella sp. PMI_857]
MEAFVAQVQTLAKSADEAGLKELMDSLRRLRYSIETPNDAMFPFGSLIKEASKDHFGPSSVTPFLADKDYQGAFTTRSVLQHLPEFLIETKHENITDVTKTPFQKVHNTELLVFAWLPAQPAKFDHFQRIMTVQRAEAPSWLSVFRLKEELGGFSTKPVFVDIGGGFGQ